MKRNLVFCTVAFFVVSCASVNTVPEPVPAYYEAARTYLPLAVGNQWVYEVDYLGQKGDLTVEIVQQQGQWFVDNRGGALMTDHRGIRDRDRYLLTFPIQQGRTWVSFLSPVEHETRTIVGADATIETPAGTFTGVAVVETVVKASPDRVLKSYHYFAPTVGIVKIETFTEETPGGALTPQTTTLLKGYRTEKGKGKDALGR